MNRTIRPETPADYDAIDRINELAFDRDNEARLIRALRIRDDFDPRLSLVAEMDDKRLIGHILFTPIEVHTTAGPLPALALAPMAVLPEWQRQGVGGNLVRTGLDHCRQHGHTRVIVLGHPQYYPRFGFVPAARFGIQPPFPVAEEVFMAIELEPGAFTDGTGTVTYPPPFEDV